MKRLHSLLTFFILCLCIATKSHGTLNEKDLAIIASYFCIPEPVFVKPLIGGIANPPMCIFAVRNGEEIPLGVLKKITCNEEFEIVRLMALEEINKLGFQNIPRVIKNAKGDYLTSINGSQYSCFEYLLPDIQEENISFSSMLELIGKL